MVREGIVLGHRISVKGMEVDRAKIDVIEKLPPPTNVKGVRSFLVMQDFIEDSLRTFQKFLNLFVIYWLRMQFFIFLKNV